MPELQGIIAAAITPRDKRGAVDFGAAFELADFLGAAGVAGIALGCATGEYPALQPEERSRLLYLMVKRSRVPVLAGVGAATLDQSVTLAREACDGGADAVLLPPPFFFRYSQDDLREFYLRFAEQAGAGLPVIIANQPRFASPIEPETALELLATGLFHGFEEGGGIEPIARLQPHAVWCGRDGIYARARCAGACGAISPAACAVPELMVALERAIASGRAERAARLDEALRPLAAWMDVFAEPVAVKTATGLRGLKTGGLLLPPGAEARRRLDEFAQWFPGWLAEVKRLAAGD